MTVGFLRPVGAQADVAELEYISALHQTDLTQLRIDGSIKDIDIVRFLSSRYGIRVTEDEVRTTVMHGLGGGDDNEACIDLMELLCILLIPTFIKASGQVESSENDRDGTIAASLDHTVPANIYGSTDHENPRPGNEEKKNELDQTMRKPLEPNPKLLQYVLDIIMHDVTGDSRPKPLTPRLLKDIFLSYGEAELANDDALLNEMVADVSRGENIEGNNDNIGELTNHQVLLDVNTFSRALTNDVLLYDVSNEIRRTTNYYDVFRTHQSSHKVGPEQEVERNVEEGESIDKIAALRAEMHPVKKKWTASAIDMAAGTCRSKLLLVLLWVAMITSYFAYLYDDTDNLYDECPEWRGSTGIDTAAAFACQVVVSIVRWFVIFWSAGGFGLFFIGVGALGNAIERRGKCALILPWIGIMFIIILSVTNYRGEQSANADAEEWLLYDASLVFSFAAVAVKVYDFVAVATPKHVLDKSRFLSRLLTPRTFVAEGALKQAASYKMNNLVSNALDIQKVNEREHVVDTHYGQALLTFSKKGETFERIGGFQWAWQQIFAGDLFRKEGVWLSIRLLAGNTSMIIAALWVLISGITLTQRIGLEYDNSRNETYAQDTIATAIERALPDPSVDEDILAAAVDNSSSIISGFLTLSLNCSAILNASTNVGSSGTSEIWEICSALNSGASSSVALQDAGFDVDGLANVTSEIFHTAASQTASDFYPAEKYMVMIPLSIGTAVAFLSAIALIFVYIPSVTSTTLQLRCGIIPTFRDPKFGLYRFGADLVTILLGSMFWGSLASSILVGGFVGCVTFFFLWQVTREWALRFIAFLVGIIIISVFRVVILVCFRGRFFNCFYRTKPARANLFSMFLEAATFGLSVGFIVMRVLKLIFSAGMWIGRIDRRFLAPGVGNLFGYFELDAYPTIYQRDILAHEAHRHPWLELLGVMYMMKLRYGENFGKQSGSCWRLIFVYALCPWMSKYRILTRPQLERKNDETSLQFMSLRKVVRASMTQSERKHSMLQGDSAVVVDNAKECEVKKSAEEASGGNVEVDLSVNGYEDKTDRLEADKPGALLDKPLTKEEENALLKEEVRSLKSQLNIARSSLIHVRGSVTSTDNQDQTERSHTS